MRLLRGRLADVGEGAQRLADGITVYRSLLRSNRDGRGTAFTTSFTLANNRRVAPVAGSASDSLADSLQKQRCIEWLQNLNGCAGEFGGLLLRWVLAPPYVEWLERRAELTNLPCPGLTRGANCFLMSVQVNCSGKKPLGGTAGDTHRDGEDDPLSYSVAVHASVLRGL
jgi:hypothetical protein